MRSVLAFAICLCTFTHPAIAASGRQAPLDAQVENSQLYTLWGDASGSRLLVGGSDGALWQSGDAGDRWIQLPVPGEFRIREFVSDGSKVLLAVSEDTLLRSADEGLSWQHVATPQGFAVNAVRYHAKTRRWIASTAQGLLLSNDGQHWQITLRTAENAALFTLGATSTGLLLAGGARGQLFVSPDGEHWRPVPTHSQANLIHFVTTPGKAGTLAVWHDGAVTALTPEGRVSRSGSTGQSDPAYVAVWDGNHRQILLGTAGGTVLRSSDMGRSWQSSLVAERAYINALHVDARSGDIFTVGARATIARSHDGGKTWDILHGNQWSSRLNGLHVSHDGNTFITVGSGGLMLRSLDRGNTWQTLRPDLGRYISEIVAVPRSHALQLIGFDGLVARSENGGIGWRIVDVGIKSAVSLQSMILDADRNRLLVCGPVGTLLRSSDGGGKWVAQQPIADAGEGFLKQLSASGSTILALGNPGRLMRSLDDGITWQATGAINGDNGFAYALTVNDKVMLAAQGDGVIQRSTDAGSMWQVVTRLQGNVSSLHRDAADGSIWALGPANVVSRSTDQGLNWTSVALPERAHIAFLLRTPAGTLLGFGDRGSIVRSTDQGRTWQQTGFISASSLRKPLLDPRTRDIWVPGRDGTLLRSSDDGQHWTLIPTHTRAHLNRLALDEATRTLVITGERLVRLPLE